MPISNQIFIGCPWGRILSGYESAIGKLHQRFPLSFTVVGRDDSQDASELLEVIKARIASSSYAIFDATGGNPNVALELGYAEGRDIPRAIYLSTRWSARSGQGSSIISDLAGKRRNHYTDRRGLERLLGELAGVHPYTRGFETFVQARFRDASENEKEHGRSLALAVVHSLDGTDSLARGHLIATVGQDKGCDPSHVERMLWLLHTAGLIVCPSGPDARVSIPEIG